MLDWKYSCHSLENVRYRISNLEKLLIFIRELYLKTDNIFEYYLLNGNIEKVCYRINYDDVFDIILVISDKKKIITIYLNNKDDKHFTLKKELYQSA